MPKYQKNVYIPKNKDKYIGSRLPIARSSWETSFMYFLDNSPSVLKWSSEAIIIRYHDPLTGKNKRYFPDFFMIYIDANGVERAEIIEVKPQVQTGRVKTRSATNQAQILRNHAKWEAALKYCAANGVGFRLITEKELGFV